MPKYEVTLVVKAANEKAVAGQIFSTTTTLGETREMIQSIREIKPRFTVRSARPEEKWIVFKDGEEWGSFLEEVAAREVADYMNHSNDVLLGGKEG